jgi:NADPH:quinone reductase-like Zn-dependent oxidoreductase
VQAQGSTQVADIALVADIAALVDAGEVHIPITRTFALEEVREAYTELAARHTRGKIVLIP